MNRPGAAGERDLESGAGSFTAELDRPQERS
jgi:hypothetical protein